MARVPFVSALFAVAVVFGSGAAQAQPLGTFRWQLQPFCNVVALAVTQNGGVYRLEGTDDQCGNGADQTSAIGMAFLNPDGTIGFGFHVVTPGGQPVHVEARLTLPSLNGTWRDSAGNAGAFAFTPGTASGGSARPLPVPAGGDVTGVIAGAGLSGGGLGGDVPIAVDTAAIQTRVSGTCAASQAVRTVNQDGTVTCEPIPDAGVPAAIQLRTDGGLLATGQAGVGAIPATGIGTRMMWHPAKAAFRAGRVNSTVADAWDDPNVGVGSTALGIDSIASGSASFAAGQETQAIDNQSVALGYASRAIGIISTAMGDTTTALGARSTAMGESTSAIGPRSTAMGDSTSAIGGRSTAMGHLTTASGEAATAMGLSSVAGGDASLAAGQEVSAGGIGSVALGSWVSASSPGTFMFGDRSTTDPLLTFADNQFLVRAVGGVGFYSNSTLTTGVVLSNNANDWSSASDVRTKTAFRALSHDEVLDRIAAMPVEEWSYLAQDPSIRHIGPMAQDFHAAFGLGADPLRIGTLDADGVALAAVRALEARTRELQAAIRQRDDDLFTLKELKEKNDALERRLAAVEVLLVRERW